MNIKDQSKRTGIWKNLGFTLGEVVMTVAIVGTLTAVAVPNYMRIKMNVNMEMVKQHLKKIGETMTEIMGRQGMFPDESTWGSGTSPEETSVTASLNAIDAKQYTNDEYTTDQNRATYSFRTCPKDGAWGISGDRCFLLDPLGIREIQPWEGYDAGNFGIYAGVGEFICADGVVCTTKKSLFGTKNPTQDQIATWFLWHASWAKVGADAGGYEPLIGKDPAIVLASNAGQNLRQLLADTIADPKFRAQLEAKGLKIAYFPGGTFPGSTLHDGTTMETYGFVYQKNFNPSENTDPYKMENGVLVEK